MVAAAVATRPAVPAPITASAFTPVNATAWTAVATTPLAAVTARFPPVAAIFPAFVRIVAAWSRLSLFAAIRVRPAAALAGHLLVALSHCGSA